MRRFPRRTLIASAVVVALLATACTGDDDDADDSSPDTTETADEGDADEPADVGDADEPADSGELDGEGLTIGFIKAPVGLFGVLGAAQAGGLALAMEDVNAGGGVLGGPLEISEQQPTPEVDVNAVFDTLIDEGTNLIVGPSSSDEALQLIPRLVEAGAVVCGASTTAPGLPGTPEAEGRFLRTTFDDNIVAVNTFNRIRQQTAGIIDRPVKVTIVARGDAYGNSVSGSLASLLTVVGTELTVLKYEPEDQLLEATASDAAASAADVVVVISLAEGPRLAKQIVDAGAPPATVLGLDGLASPRFVGKANITEPENYQDLTVIGATGPVDFLARLLDEPSSDDEVIYAAQAYDCAVSLALAVQAAGTTDPDEVSAALRQVTGDGPVCVTYAECAAQLSAGENINYDGPSGPVDFLESGEPGGGRILTSRLTGDLLRVVADLRITLDEIRSLVAPRIAGFIGDIQEALTLLGYYTGPIDGQQNEEFTAAVAAFQTDNGLEATGELNAETIAAIQEALAERGLLLNASIRDVQQLLTDLGYYTGPIDGLWSDELSQAIAAFQNDIGVQPTGILDEATLRAIYQAGFESGGGGTTTTTVPAPTTTAPPTTAAPTTTAAPAPTTTAATTTTSVAPPPSSTLPPPATALEALGADGEFSTFYGRVNTPAVLAAIPELENENAAISLFAPTNDTLSGLVPDPMALPDDEFIAMVQYQTINQALNPANLQNQDYPTLFGAETVSIGATSPPTINGTVFVQQATATASGFLYEIQGVLTPPSP